MMIHHELLKTEGILIITPDGQLESKDFKMLANTIDPYIETQGKLNGLMIYTELFPGWDNFAAFVSHIKFVKNHHQHIRKVALVTSSNFLSIIPSIIKHFVQAEIKRFDYDDKEKAFIWLRLHNT